MNGKVVGIGFLDLRVYKVTLKGNSQFNHEFSKPKTS